MPQKFSGEEVALTESIICQLHELQRTCSLTTKTTKPATSTFYGLFWQNLSETKGSYHDPYSHQL